MEFLSKVILVLLLALCVVLIGTYGAGHVIVLAKGYRLDFALSSLVIIALLLFIALYYLLRIIVNINNLPGKFKKWRRSHFLLQSRKLLNSSWIDYFEGKFESSYKRALSAFYKENNEENQFIALLLAHKSSSFIKSFEGSKETLAKLAYFDQKGWRIVKYITIAENYYHRKLYDECLDSLNKVLLIDRKHILARTIKLKAHINLRDYDKAFEELNWLSRSSNIDSQKLLLYKLDVYKNLFEMIYDEEELNYFYRKLEKSDLENPVINKYYLDALIRLHQYSKVVKRLCDMKQSNFSVDGVVIKLAKLLSNTFDIEELMVFLNNIIEDEVNAATLKLALGICNFNLQRYEESRKFLERSVELKNSLEGYLYLLLVAIKIEDHELHQLVEEKLEYYKTPALQSSDDL